MPAVVRVLLATLLFYCGCCHASENFLDEMVVTAVKDRRAIRDVSASITSVSEKELERISHTHINETLHRVPGVWISRGNGQEHLTAIRSPVLTGAGSCGAFLMMQDGISLRAPGFCNVNELFESTGELAERVEVLKGPGSDVYGSNALHGAVNVLTGGVRPGVNRLKLEVGPYDYYRTNLSYSDTHLRLDFSGTSDGGYKDESGFDQQKFLLKHQAVTDALKMTTTFSYTNLNQETAGFIRGHEVYKDAGRKRDNPNPEAYRDGRSFRLISEINKPFKGGELTFKPYLRSVDMEFLQHFLPGQAVEENGHDSLGLQTLWTNGSANWRAGFELEYTDGYLKETQPSETVGSAFLVATIPSGKHYDYDVGASLIGAFLQREFDVSEALSLTASVRFQYTRYDYDNRMISGRTQDDGTLCGFGGCRFNRPEDREDSYRNWSPKLGAIYSINDTHQLYGVLARGFRAP
ncbi:MAG: TonB-dependent receptor, partial [Gammaproteobacteria bacterium]|nr:TonB-dependent receptor [Gammaproteobacteria bacterium]